MIYSGAEIIIRFLEEHGVKIVAGIPGGANLPIYDALSRSAIRHILARHEQGAGFIAHGIARSTGQVGVCLASSGPGATNLITAIADAKLDSVPLVAITGQVSLPFIGTDAFQEIDTYGLTLPISKHNYLVKDAAGLAEILPEAFLIAGSGRPGPVVIDIPKNVQLQKTEFAGWRSGQFHNEINTCAFDRIEEMARMIHQSKRPVLFIGGGVINSGSSELIKELSCKNGIPVASTLMGLGAFPSGDPHFLGMIGMHGARYTNYILDEADLLVALGVRFDDRATGRVNEFCKNASIIHVDIDRAEIDKIKKSALSMAGDLHAVLENLIPIINADQRIEWHKEISLIREGHPFILPDADDRYNPLKIIRSISEFIEPHSIITTDVGQHQMWVAQAYPFKYPRTLLTSGGLGTMGFGLPAAIGAALANPDRRVVCISGDGSIFMNIQEFATLKELDLNITIIIMNNKHLGLVRQQQEMFYNGNIYACKFDIDFDFVRIARAFDIKSYDLGQSTDPALLLSESLRCCGPCLVNVPIHYGEKVLPIVPPGEANRNMIAEVKCLTRKQA